MKRILILTVHREYNYGAVLQAYALHKILRDLNFNVGFIDLRLPQPKQNIKSVIYKLINFNDLRSRKRKFDTFFNNYYSNETDVFYSIKELKKNTPIADIYISGSDQIWNPEITKELSLAYFLDFVSDDAKRISYASSFGVETWNQSKELTEKIRLCLSKFDKITVREESGCKICENIFGIKAKSVLDPTMLISDYNELIGKSEEQDELISYNFHRYEGFYETLNHISKTMNISKIRVLNSGNKKKKILCDLNVGIEDWLKAIRSAKFIFTDSFHGVVFSILFKRQFIVVPANPKRMTRIENLLSKFNLTDRLYSDFSEVLSTDRWKKNIDYNNITHLINIERERSLKILKQMILE